MLSLSESDIETSQSLFKLNNPDSLRGLNREPNFQSNAKALLNETESVQLKDRTD